MSYSSDDRDRRRYRDSYDYGDGYDSRGRSQKAYDLEAFEDIYSSEQRQRRAHREEGKAPTRSSSNSRASSARSTSRGRSKKKKSSGFKKFICITLAVLLLIGGAVCVYVHSVLNSINYVGVDGDSTKSSLTGSALINDANVLNIMLFGVDENSAEGGRSDTMMLLSIDNTHKKLKLTSFQRDTFVYVPDPDGEYHTKLTNAYSYGGVPLSISTIEANYGVDVDRYASVNFQSFKSIVDILGGVTVELTDDEILYINCQIAQNNQTEYLEAEAGPVLLNGQQALWYARNRGGDIINGVDFTYGTDWDRTERQRKFLAAVVDDLKDASMTEIVKIVNSIGPQITTNLKKSEILSLVSNSLTYLKYDVEQTSMPCEGSWSYEQNFAGDVIYVNDWDMTREALWSFIYEEGVTPKSTAALQ